MVSVCPKHVKNGLQVLHVPHISKLTNGQDQVENKGRSASCKCSFCHLNADYKLYNDSPLKAINKKLEEIKETH